MLRKIPSQHLRLVPLLLLWTDFTHCSGVSIVGFEQVNAGWVDDSFKILIRVFNWRKIFECHWSFKTVLQSCSVKKRVLRNFEKLTEKHLCQSLFFIKKETVAQVFPCKFCRVSKNTFLTEHLRWLLQYLLHVNWFRGLNFIKQQVSRSLSTIYGGIFCVNS